MTDIVRRNMAALRLMEDDEFKAAFDAVEKTLTADMLDQDTPEARESVFQEIRAVRGVRDRLVQWATAERLRRNSEEP